MHEKDNASKQQGAAYSPGSGIRQVRTTNVFRMLNFELYAKPVRNGNISPIQLIDVPIIGRIKSLCALVWLA